MFSAVWNFFSSSLLFWEITGYVCTFIVILGCVGEYIAEFAHIKKSDQWKHKLSKLSLIILTAGIAGELLTAIQASRISGQVISDLEGAVRSARKSASDAAADALRAKGASDEAMRKAEGASWKAQAAGLQADAAGRKVAVLGEQTKTLDGRIRQAKFFADTALARTHPRIYRMDAKKFVEKLRGVVPFDVEIRYKPDDTEAYELAEKIAQALGKGFDGTGKDGLGWTVTGPLPMTKPFSGFAFGGGFTVANAADIGDPNGGAEVWKLAAAMDAAGIHFMTIGQDASLPANTVRITILSQFD